MNCSVTTKRKDFIQSRLIRGVEVWKFNTYYAGCYMPVLLQYDHVNEHGKVMMKVLKEIQNEKEKIQVVWVHDQDSLTLHKIMQFCGKNLKIEAHTKSTGRYRMEIELDLFNISTDKFDRMEVDNFIYTCYKNKYLNIK